MLPALSFYLPFSSLLLLTYLMLACFSSSCPLYNTNNGHVVHRAMVEDLMHVLHVSSVPKHESSGVSPGQHPLAGVFPNHHLRQHLSSSQV